MTIIKIIEKNNDYRKKIVSHLLLFKFVINCATPVKHLQTCTNVFYFDKSYVMIVKLTYFGAEFETECDVSTCFYRSI